MRLLILALLFVFLYSAAAQKYATIESHDLSVKILSEARAEITTNYVVLIEDEKGYREAVYTDYQDTFRKVKELVIVVKDRNGKKVKKLGREKAREMMFNQSYQTDDSKYVVLDPEYKQFPFTVEVSSKIELKGFLNLPTWLPQSSFNVAVKSSTLEVVAPVGYKLRRLAEFVEDPVVETQEKLETTTYRWSVKDLVEKEKDLDYKTFYDKQPKVYLAPSNFEFGGYPGKLNSWTQFGDWFLELQKGRDNISEETKSFLDTLDKGDLTNTVSEIYEYMQDRVRYVSIQLGIGGFQSLPASLVDEKGYGECKALTNYMKAMLQHKGIPSNYVLVKAGWDVPDVKEEFPSNQFNHVFLAVPNESDTILLECTSQTIPANYIGTFTDDRNVLWISENSSQIIRTPVYDESENVLQKEVQMTLKKDGNAQLKITTSHKGVFYDGLGIYQSRSMEQLESYNYGLFGYSDFTINSFNYSESKGKPEFSSTFELEVNNLAGNAASKLLLPFNVLQPLELYIEANRYNKFSEVKRGFTLDEEVKIELPENYWIRNLPEDQTIKSQYGSYSLQMVFADDGLTVKRKVVLVKGKYEEESFGRFYEFIEKIRRVDTRKLVMESKT